MNTEFLSVRDNRIVTNKYEVVVRSYFTAEKKAYTDNTKYVDDDGLHELEVNLVPKHQLLEIVSKREIDTSSIAWMEGIELKTNDRQKEIAEIASYGSLEAYKASLPEVRDEYLLDLDCRMSMLELGIGGGDIL